MAKVILPLFSTEAVGMIGPKLQFQKKGRCFIAREFQKPTDAKSSRQMTQRGFFQSAKNDYKSLSLTSLDKAALSFKSQLKGRSKMYYNYFISRNIKFQMWHRIMAFPYGATVLVNSGGSFSIRFYINISTDVNFYAGYSYPGFEVYHQFSPSGTPPSFVWTVSGLLVNKYIYIWLESYSWAYSFLSGIYKIWLLP